MSVGGANYTLSTSAQDIMIRIALLPEQDTRDHEEEVQIGRELAELGICPAIFLDMRIRDAYDMRGPVYPATAIERMQHSLADVQKCPVLMRKMFVEADGESAMRACRFVRCIDTKPGNVVVSFDGIEPRVALIDVDLAHCTRLGSWKYHADTSSRRVPAPLRPKKEQSDDPAHAHADLDPEPALARHSRGW